MLSDHDLIRRLRVLLGIAAAAFLWALALLAFHTSSDPAVLSRWSIPAAFALGMLILAEFLIALLLFRSSELLALISPIVSKARDARLFFWLISLANWVILAVIWYWWLPQWPALFETTTIATLALVAAALLLFQQLALNLSPGEATPDYAVLLHRTAWFLVLTQLLISVLLSNTGFDDGTLAYHALLVMSGRASLYDPAGLPTIYFPLEYIPDGLALTLFGGQYIAMRLTNMALSLAGLVITLYTLKQLGGRSAQLIALVLLGISSPILRSLPTASPFGFCFFLFSLLFLVTSQSWTTWLRIGMTFFLAGLVVLTRHTLFITLPITLIYILITERRGPVLAGVSLGTASLLILIGAFWPNLPMLFTFWGRFVEVFRSQSQTTFTVADVIRDIVPTLQAYFVLLGSVLWVGIVTLRHLRFQGWPSIRSRLYLHRGPGLAACIFAGNFLFGLGAPLRLFTESDNLILYMMFFVQPGIFASAYIIARVWKDHVPQAIRTPRMILWGLVSLLIINTGWLAALHYWQYPSPLTGITQLQQRISAELRPDDTALIIAPWHVMIAFPDLPINPELTWGGYHYYSDRQSTDFWFYDDQQLTAWLSEDATLVIVETWTYNWLEVRSRNAGDVYLMPLIDAELRHNFQLVDELSTSIVGSNITSYSIYRRIKP